MTDVLDEVTGEAPSRDDVQRRVDDWVQRISGLYSQVEAWLPDGWTVERKRTRPMHEEVMREVGLPPRDLPILDLVRDGRPAARIEPRGLWIIGANGRLDLVTGTAHYLVIDTADNFARPHWCLAPLADRRALREFDRAALLEVL